jgi:anti-sigma factor RsiW
MNGDGRTDEDRLMELIGRYADGGATADEARELSAALRADPALRRRFLRYMNVDSALGSAAAAFKGQAEPSEPSAADVPPVPPARYRLRWVGWISAVGAIAAVLGVAVSGTWRFFAPEGETPPPGPSASTGGGPIAPPAAPPPVALAAVTNAVWADPDIELSLRSGDLPAGLLRLESGSAEFRFAAGATAVLVGPASVRFPGPERLYLEEGRALLRCPTPESRLTLDTPAVRVVDLGTEFAVEAAPSKKATRVAVVSGEVRLGAGGGRVLRTGEAAEVGPDGVVRLTPLPADALAELLAAHSAHAASATHAEGAADGFGPNLLIDPAPAAFPAGGPWRATEGHVEPVPTPGGDGSGRAIAVRAAGHRFWPGVRQIVATGDIGGRTVVATAEVRAASADPLIERQSAIVKIAFRDERGREFATTFRRHVPDRGRPSPASATVRVAAVAPAGTRSVELQLLLSARGLSAGTVVFENPALRVSAAKGSE